MFTNTRTNSFKATESDIINNKIVKIDSIKAHRYDNSSIRMIKMCSESITLSLKAIFQKSLKKGKFPEIWTKANVIPVNKKEGNTFIVNYCPIIHL